VRDGRPHPRLYFGGASEAAERVAATPFDPNQLPGVGQQRLLDLGRRGDVLDDNLYTAPGRFGGGGAGSTWLVGSVADVAASLRKYRALGITHFVLSGTPYLPEIRRQGEQLLPLLRT
jgi:alkanesulfonate monooxygenase